MDGDAGLLETFNKKKKALRTIDRLFDSEKTKKEFADPVRKAAKEAYLHYGPLSVAGTALAAGSAYKLEKNKKRTFEEYLQDQENKEDKK